mgnify:CR=1 FL=1
MLTQHQQEALQEIANIGMGQAGASIAQALDHFVVLSIPRILAIRPENTADALRRTVGDGNVTAVRQSFRSFISGEALVIFNEQRCSDLADLMGYDTVTDHAEEMEMLLDISNILVGACLKGIGEQMQADISFAAPSLFADAMPVGDLLRAEELPWQNALLVEVNFGLEQRNFACHLIVFLEETQIAALGAALERFLAAY